MLRQMFFSFPDDPIRTMPALDCSNEDPLSLPLLASEKQCFAEQRSSGASVPLQDLIEALSCTQFVNEYEIDTKRKCG